MIRIRLGLLVALMLTLPGHAVETMPVAAIRPGMTGHGLTVFQGTTIERFDVDILGVLTKADLDGDWIMFRMTSGPVIKRGGGIVAGMSGSPVYIDGKLIGAVAYGPQFSLEPIGFITPIENMLNGSPAVSGRTAQRTLPLSAPLAAASGYRRVQVADSVQPVAETATSDTLVVTPLSTPVMVAGMSPRGVAALDALLRPYHLTALQGGAGGAAAGRAEIEPGAAMGVGLVSGDVSMTAIGTVTWRDGDRVIGFGHPMMQRNQVALPLTSASVLGYFTSSRVSSKVGMALEAVGTISDDGHFGVGGRLGALPRSLPMTVRLVDADRGLTRTLNCRIADDDDLSAPLALSVAVDAVQTWVGMLPTSMYHVRTEVKCQGAPPVVRRQVGPVTGPPQQALLGDLAASLQTVLNNPFGRLPIEAVKVDLTVRRGDDSAVISRAYVDRAVVEPGETVRVELDLRRRRDGQVRHESIELKVPANATAGRTRLIVAGGAAEPTMRNALKLLAPPPQNTDQYLRAFAETDTDNQSLVVYLALPQADLAVRGETFPAPPPLLDELLSNSGTTDLARGQTAVRVAKPCDLVVLNGATAQIAIDGAPTGGSEGTPPAQPSSVQVLPELADPGPSRLRDATGPLSLWQRIGQTAAAVTGGDWSALAAKADDAPRPPRRPEPPKVDATKPTTSDSSTRSDSVPPGRATRSWLHRSAKDFLAGELRDLGVASDGGLMLGLGTKVLARGHEPLFWCADHDGQGRCYVGTGNNGELLRLTADGKLEVAWKAPEPVITAIVCAPDGVYFATAPSGRLRRLGADGKVTDVAATGATYVWRLLRTRAGALLAVTGRPARLLQIAGGRTTTLFESDCAHLLALAEATDGTLYLSGTNPGRIIRRCGTDTQVVAATGDAVAAMTVLDSGTVVYGDGNALHVLAANAPPRAIGPFDGPAITALLPTSLGLMVSVKAKNPAASSTLWVCDVPAEKRRRVAQIDSLAVTALAAVAPQQVIAFGSDAAQAVRLTLPAAAEGTFESAVLDAGAPARWGAIELGVEGAAGAAVTIETRSGNSAKTGDDWSGWANAAGRVNSPAARYLQYRLKLRAGPAGGPRVRTVRVYYVHLNLPPQVGIEAPGSGDTWRGKQAVRWKVVDPNGDQPLVTVYIRPEGATEWKVLAQEVPASQGKVDLDTKAWPDGRYRVRVVADDVLNNPDQPKQAEETSEVLVIDNTPPKVALGPVRVVGDQIELTAVLTDNLALRSAEWRLDGGTWLPALPQDGLFDSEVETVLVRTLHLKPGEHTIELRAQDAAGNWTEVKRPVTVPAKKGG